MRVLRIHAAAAEESAEAAAWYENERHGLGTTSPRQIPGDKRTQKADPSQGILERS